MRYSPIIQKTIEYIEKSLQEELSLENIARFAGFSKFHYHRIFLKEVGVTVSEYIRYRRIANAANMLLYTDEKIIDIAFYTALKHKNPLLVHLRNIMNCRQGNIGNS